MGVSWISYRKKHELEAILLDLGLEQNGTVEEQRARLYAFARQPEHSEDTLIRLGELERKYTPSRDVKPPSRIAPYQEKGREGNRRAPHAPVHPSPTQASARWWSTKRPNGDCLSTAPPTLSFVEHIEERADTYRIDRKYLSHAIIVLLTGRAESWFRTSDLQGRTWTEVRREFLEFFLPPRYYQRLDDEIRSHFQKVNEPFKEYLVDLRLQMRRAGFSPEQELERVYENMLPEYQMFTRRQDFKTLTELTHLVVNYEVARSRGGRPVRGYPSTNPDAEYPPQSRNARPRANPAHTPKVPRPGNATNDAASRGNGGNSNQGATPTRSTDPSTTCRICGQAGHYATECRNQRTMFCWDCGRQGRELTQALRITIQLGKARVSVSALIMADVLDDLLLGMDFLCYGGATLQSVQRNPFRKGAKRVRFSDLEPPPPSCGIVDAEYDAEEEPKSRGHKENYPEPWIGKFLERELSRFNNIANVSHIAEHKIVMRHDRPIKQRYYPRNPAMRAVIDQQMDELIRDGRIEPSKSPHSAPIVIAAKKNGEARMCIDYRQLNDNSIPDAYPLPRIHHILERLRNAR
ncbi:uncharacterized protein LOC122319963 [Drosophila ficusphila]|uniref:uncharacterized protein LOC122319963 n=1 Tax=Drosophila ficusphila TaxID=30025 RepID=UPI001C8989D5|nr:uncharacterized protein LOC122319963 [Drosophila ficusphila]